MRVSYQCRAAQRYFRILRWDEGMPGDVEFCVGASVFESGGDMGCASERALHGLASRLQIGD